MQQAVSFSQTIKVKAHVDTLNIRIGDQVRLHLEVDQPGNLRVGFPVITDTLSGKVDVVKQLKADSTLINNSLHIKKDYLITSFDSGQHTIPALEFTVQEGTKTDTFRTMPIYLNVNTIPVDTTKGFRDIKAPIKAPISLAEVWPYLTGLLGLIIIGVIIWILVRRNKHKPIFGIRKPAEPPHIVALRELDQLRNDKLWQQSKEKQYYTRLTEILRLYLENRFQIAALEMTSEEIMQAMKRVSIENPNDLQLLSIIFTTSDLVKFAKAHPLPDENEVVLLNAFQFVNNTKPFVRENPAEAEEKH